MPLKVDSSLIFVGGQSMKTSDVIDRYTEVINNVQTQETILNIQFVLLDCSPLKNSILAHCLEWQKKFTTLLSEIGTKKLNDLHNFLKSNSERYVTYYLRIWLEMILFKFVQYVTVICKLWFSFQSLDKNSLSSLCVYQ